MRDIALEGVVPSTVSRVLNNAPSRVAVAPATRQRILDAAERLRYRPNPIARA
jgi:DNA-binding LacI/PurR family transcriptional regulator